MAWHVYEHTWGWQMDADREYLAAGYVLGGLSSEEESLARSLEASDPHFQEELELMRETMALVGESDEPVTPSSETEAAILSIPNRHPRPADTRSGDTTPDAAEPQEAPSSSESLPLKTEEAQKAPRRRGGRSSTIFFALAASVLLVLATVLGGLLFTQAQDQQDMEESLTAAESERQETERLLGAPDLSSAHAESAEGGSLTVTYSVAEEMIHVVPHDVPAPEPDQTMQMWLIDDQGAQSIGLMGGETSELLADVEFDEGVSFGVTVEPEGGSPEPSDEPIIVAQL